MTVKNSQASGWNSRNKWNVAIALIFVNYFLRRQPWLLLCTVAEILSNCPKITLDTDYIWTPNEPLTQQNLNTKIGSWSHLHIWGIGAALSANILSLCVHNLQLCIIIYCKAVSSNTSRLEAHSGFFRLLMYCDLLIKSWIPN